MQTKKGLASRLRRTLSELTGTTVRVKEWAGPPKRYTFELDEYQAQALAGLLERAT